MNNSLENKKMLTLPVENGILDIKHLALSDPTVAGAIMQAKRSNIQRIHDGKIWLGKNGKWMTHYRDSNGKRKLLQYANKSDLLDRLFCLYEGRMDQKTINDVFLDWLNGKINHKEIGTSSVDRYTQDFNRFFVRYEWDKKCIADLTEGDIEDYVKDLIVNENLTNKGFSGLRTLMFGIWRYGKRHGYTDLDIRESFETMDISKKSFAPNKKGKSDQVFNDDEVTVILTYLREYPDTLNRAILLDFLTGMRIGELVALKKSDLVRGRYLHVQRTETNTKGAGINGTGQIVVDHAKTDAGDREVYLSDEAVSVVTQLLVDPGAVDSEWLLVGTFGHKRVIRATLEKRFKRVLEKLSIPHRSFHKIRKTYASRLIDQKVDENIIIDQLGHSDISITKSHYYFSHQSENVVSNQLEKAVAGL